MASDSDSTNRKRQAVVELNQRKGVSESTEMPRKPPVEVNCRRCGQVGHISDNCTTVQCKKCGHHGHNHEKCPQLQPANRIRVWFMHGAELTARFSRQRRDTDYDRIESFIPLHEIPDDIGPEHRYHFGTATVSFRGSGMRRVQLRLSERATFDETLLSIDSKRINIGQRYVIEGNTLNASVQRSSIGQRGRAIPVGEGMCYLTIIGVDLFQQLVCVEVDEQRYVLCWEGTAAGRRMRANVTPIQEFEAIVNMRNPRNRLSLQQYFAPAIEAMAFGGVPPADRPNANILAVVEIPPNIVINEQAAVLQPIDLNALVLVPEEGGIEENGDAEEVEENAGEPIQVNENDDDVVIEHEELMVAGVPADVEFENRDVEAVANAVAVVEAVVDNLIDDSIASDAGEEWHEPMEDVEELEGAAGGAAAEPAPDPDDAVIRCINRLAAKRMEWLDANAARLFAEFVVRQAMPLKENAPDEVLVDSEKREKEEEEKKSK